MSPNITLSLLVGVLVGTGVAMLLGRGVIRSLLGVLLIGNGVNLLILVAGGPPGAFPLVGLAPEAQMADPLPQAFILTAIVITLAMTGFVVALAHRSWQLQRTDVVDHDDEDLRIQEKAARNDLSDSDFPPVALDVPDPGDDPDPGGHHRCGDAGPPAPARPERPRRREER